MTQPSTLEPDEYDEWLDRVRSTYEAVRFTCHHRLGDRLLASRVSAQVVAGMLARPGVFRFFGMPFSARVGHLAEEQIAAARRGELQGSAVWPELERRLRELTEQQRRVFVLSFVHGSGTEETARKLGVPEEVAHDLRDDVLRLVRGIAGTNEIPGDGT
ncbi:hypothetical protein H7X46_28055 [Pseudonocardia sp. C8]|uniref:sigma factor-like helix-turn-helix DNA-binding protein n=1 Tax=Pseudonocardia sp. C8 TaxID=2762759 RepID=UPI0016436654|nr:sigma factor-like helix-turn-helix DNA-binding protein [Pseudonocardia sp. C8]MBC3194912.1 hypothetical protein [Pseudonocardia sp. C8]